MQMRILLTHELFPPDFAGGGEWHVLQTARYLIRRGVDVRVLTTGNPDIVSFDGIPTVRLAIHRYGLNLRASTVAEHARDVCLIQTFNFHACLASQIAAARLRKPIVCGVLGVYGSVWNQMKGPLLGPLWSRWERFVLRRPFSRLVFLSDYSLRMGTEMGVSPRKSVVIPTGVELEMYTAAGPKKNEVLFVGKFDVRKGVYDLLAAAKRLPDVPFRFIGWGSGEAAVRAAAAPNVTIEILRQGDPPIEAFARASIFALPSHVEGMSRAVLEAMASGCAIVSCMPGKYQGRQVPVCDIEQLIAALRQLWLDEPLTRSYGVRNSEIAREYTWESYVDSLLRVYSEVLAESGQHL
jgi:glycosyltransferase involved in cell wall biosynthesis